VIIIFLAITVSGFGQTIEGTVIDGRRKETIPFASIQLLNASSTSTKDSAMADVDGGFKFTNVSGGIYCIKIKFIGYKDTIFCNIKISSDTTLKLDIHRFCQYDSLEKNKTCPVCHKHDKVIPIRYGLLITINGMKGEGKKFKAGGCNISSCDPYWYCKRDKTEF